MENELWPAPSDRVCELMRNIAEKLLPLSDGMLDELAAASLQDPQYREFAADPVLAETDRRLVAANLKRWLRSNIQSPGRRVPNNASPETLIYARDVVLRGLVLDELPSWRATQRTTWRWWLNACFSETSDLQELPELIEVSANSLTTFADDWIEAVAAHVDEVRNELAGGAHLQRYATVELLLQGSRIVRPRAEAQLGYALTGRHVAAIVWTDSDVAADLEQAAEQTMRACGVTTRLTVVASTAALWLWMPVRDVPAPSDVMSELSRLAGTVRVAFGRPGDDVAGFRRSHMEAAAAQRLLTRLQSRLSVVRYEDVQLVDLLTADVAQADQFVKDTLGDLVDTDPLLMDTVSTYIDERFNRSSTAQKLFTHRNTIDRRLARVDELLPQPLNQNSVSVAAALQLLKLRAST